MYVAACIGGELQYSTDVICVSGDGTDSKACLIGSSHCKTLGYVVTNIAILQCSNCTIRVVYDHVVGPLNSSTLYNVNMNALKCREPSPALMQMSTCAYLIITCGIRRACHFSQNG